MKDLYISHAHFMHAHTGWWSAWMVECMDGGVHGHGGGAEITHEMHGHQMNLSMEAN